MTSQGYCHSFERYRKLINDQLVRRCRTKLPLSAHISGLFTSNDYHMPKSSFSCCGNAEREVFPYHHHFLSLITFGAIRGSLNCAEVKTLFSFSHSPWVMIMKKPESCQNHKLLTPPSAEIQLIKQPRSVVEYRLACMYRGCVIYWKNWHSEQWKNIKSEAKPFQLQRAYVKFMLWLLDFLQIESRAPNRMEMRFTRLRRSSLVRLIEEVAIRARPTIFFLSRNANWHRR